jgi:hypothetical protein
LYSITSVLSVVLGVNINFALCNINVTQPLADSAAVAAGAVVASGEVRVVSPWSFGVVGLA